MLYWDTDEGTAPSYKNIFGPPSGVLYLISQTQIITNTTMQQSKCLDGDLKPRWENLK